MISPQRKSPSMRTTFLCVLLTIGFSQFLMNSFQACLALPDAQRRHCELGGMGTSLHWPDIDEDLSVEGLVLGRRIIDWQKPVQSPKKTSRLLPRIRSG